ncbi:CPBP family intramembrane metalloprotease [Salmonella enterica subsp. enterica serovar Typhimurium]|nr:CPBP family intramembrane metalloprotease [Salmonella enterica subsp. enterica serovar Typhimurium]
MTRNHTHWSDTTGVHYIIILIVWYLLLNVVSMNFWVSVIVCLMISSILIDRGVTYSSFKLKKTDIVYGVLSAVFLYIFFLTGSQVLLRCLSEAEIQSVYTYASDFKPENNFWVIIIPILTGPTEEVIWRGYFQRTIAEETSQLKGWGYGLGAYVLFHCFTFNPVLIITSLICGAFWGGLYVATRSLTVTIFSHSVWNIMIFIMFPLSSGV